MRQYLWFLVKLIISVGVLAFLVFAVDSRDLLKHVAAVPAGVVAIATLLYFIATFISTIRWKNLLEAEEINVPLVRLFSYNLSYNFYSIALPGGKVAAEAIRLYQLTSDRECMNRESKTIIPTLIDRSSVLIISGISAALYFLIAPAIVQESLPAWFPAAGLISIVVIAFFFLIPIEKIFSLKKSYKKVSYFEEIIQGFPKYRSKFFLLASTFVLSLVMNLMISFGILIIAHSLSIPITFTEMYFLHAVGLVAAFIPLSVAGIGIRESVFAYLISVTTGVPLDVAVALSLVSFASTLVLVFFGGLVEIYRHFANQIFL